jgi:hypothetical protein
MRIGRTLLLVCFVSAGLAVPALEAQSQERLTARELFYAPAAAEQPAKPNPPKKPKKPAAQKPSAPAEVAAVPKAGGGAAAPVHREQGSIPLVQASYGKLKPLGLRYSFLRKSSGDEYEEVSADSVFHAGDRIRVSVEANDAAYLYIVMRGSSGTWKLLFPSSEIGGGSNRIEAGRSYVFPPPPGRFAFDEQKGEEKICLVLSRQPEQSLEELIYALSSGGSSTQPASDKAPERAQPTLLAVNRPIEDGLIDRLRNQVYARDLVFEKVDDSTPGEKKEKAAYVVNSNASPEARLVVDLTLKHE